MFPCCHVEKCVPFGLFSSMLEFLPFCYALLCKNQYCILRKHQNSEWQLLSYIFQLLTSYSSVPMAQTMVHCIQELFFWHGSRRNFPFHAAAFLFQKPGPGSCFLSLLPHTLCPDFQTGTSAWCEFPEAIISETWGAKGQNRKPCCARKVIQGLCIQPVIWQPLVYTVASDM